MVICRQEDKNRSEVTKVTGVETKKGKGGGRRGTSEAGGCTEERRVGRVTKTTLENAFTINRPVKLSIPHPRTFLDCLCFGLSSRHGRCSEKNRDEPLLLLVEEGQGRRVRDIQEDKRKSITIEPCKTMHESAYPHS